LDRWLSCYAGAAIARVGACADELGYRVFLVGGPVRDLLLGCASLDLDVVVAGDAVELAQAAMAGEPPPVLHRSFGTATIAAGRYRVDLASARAESYAYPGALPVVRPGTIEQDLRRRDFTVNAMALSLNGCERGALLDPFNGWQDLQRGLLRVLHEDSFRDDATRILRGVRYEQRLGFAFEERTMQLLRRDMAQLVDISADRVRHELERTFDEDAPELSMLRLDDLGLLAAIHPALQFGETKAWSFARARNEGLSGAQLECVYWCILAWDVPGPEMPSLCTRLNPGRRMRAAMSDVAELAGLEALLGQPALQTAEVYRLLHGREHAAVSCAQLMYRQAAARRQVALYLDRLCHVRISLNGRDLKLLGVHDGPEMGRILDALRTARLNGEVSSREEESVLVRRLLAGA